MPHLDKYISLSQFFGGISLLTDSKLKILTNSTGDPKETKVQESNPPQDLDVIFVPKYLWVITLQSLMA